MDQKQELQQKIIKKAMTDPAFKKELLGNPKEAIKKSFNINVPENIKLNVVEETSEQFYLVLPSSPEETKEANVVWP